MASTVLKNVNIAVAITIVSLMIVCSKNHNDYDVKVRFVDSTFVNSKETYSPDEIIYILATESCIASMPETITVSIESGLGDFEIIKCWFPKSVVTIPEIHIHGGRILSLHSSTFNVNNDTLETDYPNDVITVLYEVKNQTAVDTAYVIAP